MLNLNACNIIATGRCKAWRVMTHNLPLVVANGVCIGCGACAVAEPEQLKVSLTELGTYIPVRRDGGDLGTLPVGVAARASAVCPFAGGPRDEDTIASDLFGEGAGHHSVTGFHRKIVAGHVRRGDFRDKGTSGGMTTWVLAELMESGEIDAVIHVASTFDGLPDPLSRYKISRTVDEVMGNRKSRYQVQTLVDVLTEVKATSGRYAVVGVPCFIKAVRLLAENDPIIDERIVFAASLFCGHQKSTLYSDYLGRSMGVEPAAVSDIDYRHKEPGRPPNRYCAKVTTEDGEEIVKGAEQIPLANWGIGLFKVGACDYCDDIVGETADISLGDAWMPPFMSDWRGANVAIARSERAVDLLRAGEQNGDLEVVPWTPEEVAESQAGAVRHRRDGLAVRLADRDRRGVWAPRKRVQPAADADLETPFAKRMLNRQELSRVSGPLYLSNEDSDGLEDFLRTMDPYVKRYDGSRSSTVWRRAVTWIMLRSPRRVEAFMRRVARALKLI